MAAGAVTATVADPCTPPSATAWSVAVPAATAVTRAVVLPVLLTVATDGLDELHVTATVPTPGSASTAAVTVALSPRASDTAGTVTLRTPATTSEAVPCTPPAFADTVTEPRLTPVTVPLPFTVATAGLELVHPDTPPGRALPRARTAAESCTCPPTGTVVAEADTLT
jgi:hypothetical protein